MQNYNLIINEIKNAIHDLELNLSELTVLTEAANGCFIVSPIIACLANAKKVIAIGKDSKYGTFDDAKQQILKFAEISNIDISYLDIINKKDFNNYQQIDIVANLGHVRPLNHELLSKLKKTAVISFMSESWEFRKDDLDLDFCRKQKIKVSGLNENFKYVNCFVETGLLALKMLIETRASLPNANIIVISRDNFGKQISRTLLNLCKKVELISDFTLLSPKIFNDTDIVIVADFHYKNCIIGDNGLIDPSWIKTYAHIIQFCGNNNITDIEKKGIQIYPNIVLAPHRMSQTLGDVSDRSIIRLHTGGLKVGELLVTNNNNNVWNDLIQFMA